MSHQDQDIFLWGLWYLPGTEVFTDYLVEGKISLGTKFLVVARWVNYSAFKELRFTGALDRSKGNVCREQAGEVLESRGGRGRAEQRNGFCQLAY